MTCIDGSVVAVLVLLAFVAGMASWIIWVPTEHSPVFRRMLRVHKLQRLNRELKEQEAIEARNRAEAER